MLPQSALMFVPLGSLCATVDVGAEFAQNAGRRFVSRAVRDIDRDAHFLERHSARKTGFGELHIAPERVIDSGGAADFSAVGRMESISPVKTSCSICCSI